MAFSRLYVRTYYSMYHLDTTYCLRHREMRERKGDLTRKNGRKRDFRSIPEIGISMSQREFVKLS